MTDSIKHRGTQINPTATTTENAEHNRTLALQKLSHLGYNTTNICNGKHCRCCIPSIFNLYTNPEALAAWEEYDRNTFLAGKRIEDLPTKREQT